MSSLECPYCELKEAAKVKTVFTYLRDPIDGICPDCGAYIDKGQYQVEINGYADIYRGAIHLIDYMVEQFNELLKECDVDLADYVDTVDGRVELTLNTSYIIEELFARNYGGTTKRNIAMALEIGEYSHKWEISKEEANGDW